MSSPQDALNNATATAASVQALAAALQQHSMQPGFQQKVTLPPFWPQDPAAWFQHIEAEFVIARIPLTSYLCYLHVIRALPADVITAICDITSQITAESFKAYDAIKRALLQHFTSSPLQRCFQLLDSPPLGDRNIAAHYSQLRSLIPADADVLFNAIFLRTLPAHISTDLADRAELPSAELAVAAAQMQHTVAAQAAVAAATPLPPSLPPSVSAAPSQRYSRSPGHSAASRGRQATPYRRRYTSRDNRRLCWYHQNSAAKPAVVRPSIVTGKTNSGSGGNSHRLSAIADRSRPNFSSPPSPPPLPHGRAHQQPLPGRYWCSSQPHPLHFQISTFRTYNSQC
jgi:hypothetical protein